MLLTNAMGVVLACTAMTDADSATFEHSSARVVVRLIGSQYVYTVTNLGPTGVTHFEIAQWHGYGPEAPPGWQVELDGLRYRAWTDDPTNAISTHHSGTFRLRVGSSGAVLGESDAHLRFADGREAAVPNVWCPQPVPSSSVVAIGLWVTLIVLVHAAWIYRRRERIKAVEVT